jgi:hypothetical protein
LELSDVCTEQTLALGILTRGIAGRNSCFATRCEGNEILHGAVNGPTIRLREDDVADESQKCSLSEPVVSLEKEFIH